MGKHHRSVPTMSVCLAEYYLLSGKDEVVQSFRLRLTKETILRDWQERRGSIELNKFYYDAYKSFNFLLFATGLCFLDLPGVILNTFDELGDGWLSV